METAIAGFHLTSWRLCWSTLNKRILIISFVWDSNMAAMSIVFCVSWDCVKPKNSPVCAFYELTKIYVRQQVLLGVGGAFRSD